MVFNRKNTVFSGKTIQHGGGGGFQKLYLRKWWNGRMALKSKFKCVFSKPPSMSPGLAWVVFTLQYIKDVQTTPSMTLIHVYSEICVTEKSNFPAYCAALGYDPGHKWIPIHSDKQGVTLLVSERLKLRIQPTLGRDPDHAGINPWYFSLKCTYTQRSYQPRRHLTPTLILANVCISWD